MPIRHFIAATLLATFTIAVYPEEFQITKTIPCDTFQAVMELLTKQYKETPIAMFNNPKNNITTIITANTANASWTALETDGENACLVSTGQGFRFNNEVLKNPGKTVHNVLSL